MIEHATQCDEIKQNNEMRVNLKFERKKKTEKEEERKTYNKIWFWKDAKFSIWILSKMIAFYCDYCGLKVQTIGCVKEYFHLLKSDWNISRVNHLWASSSIPYYFDLHLPAILLIPLSLFQCIINVTIEISGCFYYIAWQHRDQLVEIWIITAAAVANWINVRNPPEDLLAKCVW